MEQKFVKTPLEFEEMLRSMGMTDEKLLKEQVKVYEKGFKQAKKYTIGEFDTPTSVDYINEKMKERGLIKTKRDKYHVKKFLEQVKSGKVRPINPDAPKKHGFTFKQEELDRFVEWVKRVKTANVEELLLKIEELEQQVKQLQGNVHKEDESEGTNTLPTEEKRNTSDSGASDNEVFQLIMQVIEENEEFKNILPDQIQVLMDQINTDGGLITAKGKVKNPLDKRSTFDSKEEAVTAALEKLKNGN